MKKIFLTLIIILTLPFNQKSSFVCAQQLVCDKELSPVLQSLISNMVFVEGGTFTMGATGKLAEGAESDEKVLHEVTLSSYYICKYEVTQALWKTIMGKNPSNFVGDRLPVENVTWYDCQEFIGKLDSLTGLAFRLPTEAEWEYAARGGNKTQDFRFSGSDDPDEVAWHNANSGGSTHSVGSKKPNELGLYDMSGNVYEWCNDWKGKYPSEPQTNPQGPATGTNRVNRGGRWGGSINACRVSDRSMCNPNMRFYHIGLRLVLSAGKDKE